MIESLLAKNLSRFGQIEVNFCAGMNVLTGVNGVGKSRMLALISLLLSQTSASGKAISEVGVITHRIGIGGEPTSTEVNFGLEYKPLVLFFSAHRSVFKLETKKSNALEPKNFDLVTFVDWWLECSEQARLESGVTAQRNLATVNRVVALCLGWDCVFAASKESKDLLIQKTGGVSRLALLSNGEKAVAAIVLEVVRNLAESNPHLDNPLNGKAIVLIDELELHLHPKWQRTIVRQLTTAFPNCQFIATTNSPLIISELQPQQLSFLLEIDGKVTARPAMQAYGLDANWVLEHLMNTHARPKPTKDLIDDIEDLLQEGNLDKAREKVAELKEMLHGVDGEAVRLEASIDSLETLAMEDGEPF